jgi:hypothetical protein
VTTRSSPIVCKERKRRCDISYDNVRGLTKPPTHKHKQTNKVVCVCVCVCVYYVSRACVLVCLWVCMCPSTRMCLVYLRMCCVGVGKNKANNRVCVFNLIESEIRSDFCYKMNDT